MPWMSTKLANEIHEKIPEFTVLPRLYTTRPPEKGEQEGSEFHFVKPDAFEKMRRNGDFISVREDCLTAHLRGITWEEVNKHSQEGLMVLVACTVEDIKAVRNNRVPGALCIQISRGTIEVNV